MIALTGTSLALAYPVSAPAADAYSAGDRFTALLFGEIDYLETQADVPDGFVIGQSVAQVTLRIDDRLSLFSEATATARRQEDFEFEIERLFVRYDFSDQYKLSAGRYHTPLGYWNAAFHHGSWLQTTVGRPNTVKFGSNVIPIHFVGALLEGKVAKSNFGYRIGFGNGRSEEINDPGDFGDTNGNRAWMVSGDYRNARLHLDTGFSIYVDEVDPEVGPEVDETISSAYVALQGERPEVIVEYTYADHDANDVNGNGSLHSVYGQVAYRLGGRASQWKPYVRGERLDVDDADPLLGDLGLDYEGVTAGVRWDFSPYAALKAEVRQEEFDRGGSDTSVWLQLSFVFDVNERATIRASTPGSRATPR